MEASTSEQINIVTLGLIGLESPVYACHSTIFEASHGLQKACNKGRARPSKNSERTSIHTRYRYRYSLTYSVHIHVYLPSRQDAQWTLFIQHCHQVPVRRVGVWTFPNWFDSWLS